MKRDMIFAGEFWHGSSGAGLAHGFRQQGWNVAEIDTRDHEISGRTLITRLAARVMQPQSAESFNQAVLAAIKTIQPSVFFTVKGRLLHRTTLLKMKEQGITLVDYYPDVLFEHPGLDIESLKLYDLFFSTKSYHIDYLKSIFDHQRVYLLQHGYSSLVHRPRLDVVDETDYIADVLYVGNYSGYKERWISAIASEFSNIRILVVGHGWSEVASRYSSTIKCTERPIVGDAYANLVQRAKINLAFHSGPHGSRGWADLVSTRTFEIPACRGFMLHIANEEVQTLFKPGEEIALFSDESDLCSAIKTYLQEPDNRKLMVDRAFRRCVPKYSYDERAKTMTGVLDEFIATRTMFTFN